MTQWLDDPRLLEETQRRIAAKLQHLDAPRRRTLRLRAQRAELVTEQAERYRDSLDAVLERAGFDLSGRTRYRLQDANAMLTRLFAGDTQLRMGAKTRLSALGVLLEGAAVASTPTATHPLHRLVETVLGPADEDERQDEDDHQQASRTLRASAERPRARGIAGRGTLLVDRQGQPIRLRSRP